jgi:uncharacterized protein (TIGR00251 family)
MSGTPHPVDQIDIQSSAKRVTVTVKVVPGATRTRIAGVLDRALRVAVAAPPEAGKANDELLRFVTRKLGLKRGDVEIVRGHTQRLKIIAVSTLAAAAIRDRLREWLDES